MLLDVFLKYSRQYCRTNHRIDAAGIVTPENSIVATFTPFGTPRVLYNPVGQRFVKQWIVGHAIAHDKNSMVNIAVRAQGAPRMRNPSFVKLHCVCVQTF